MFKKQSKKEKKSALTDCLLEGGGDESKITAINNSMSSSRLSARRSSSSKSEMGELETHMQAFEQYNDLFTDLTRRQWINTELDVVQIVINYTSKYVIAIANDKDEHFEIQQYSLENYQKLYTKEIKGEYLKMNLVEQSNCGGYFAVAYQDNGKYFVLFFDEHGKELDLLNVSQKLAIDDKSKPITGFWEPLITVCFVERNVFISAYHRFQRKQYHFLYSFFDKKVLSQVMVNEIKDCTQRNFPIKSFYSEETGDCYTFYRQGHCFTTSAKECDNKSKITLEKITDADLGNMYLLFDKALVTRSSSSILFFKIDPETGLWTQYQKFPHMRGQIYFIRGNVRIQVVTDEKVYFFKIDKETLEPHLENVMYNTMSCSMMMFGTKVRYGITYKANQPGFTVYTRKYFHNFKVAITNANCEGSKGANLTSMGAYIMAEQTKIGVYNDTTFESI